MTRNRVLRIGSVVLLIGFLALSIDSLTTRFGDGVSWWDAAIAVALVLGAIGFVCNVIERWRPPPASAVHAPLATVDDSDVDAAIAETHGRVDAVRVLRERHPGLGLGEAARLIDERRPT